MRRNVALAATLVLALAAGCAAHAVLAPRADDGSNLVGDWEGESKCGAGFPSCRDEHVVYHITKPPDEAGNVSIAADKIVDGKPVPMGVVELKYDGAQHTLRGELKNTRYSGVWEFKVEGDTMEGTLTTQPDGKVARRIKVKKVS
ncbi:MAG TPA: hypothetical protein VFA21_02565 [Pyrinomonadaceae bacterium]|jgi:hypothetical protein|nr:hypothetical protein [Pyrinomonadaceae bacterium]